MTSGQELLTALDHASRGIRDPVAKLRFIRGSLARQHGWDRVVQSVPGGPLRHWLYRRLGHQSLLALLRTNPLGARPTREAPSRRALAWNRPLAALGALAVLSALGAALLAARMPRSDGPATSTLAARGLPTPAESLPARALGMEPTRIWLVEQGSNWEQYSHGLRIDTSFAVDGDPRRFRVFRPGLGLEPDPQSNPVGILFHTSESDIWPLEEAFNESLRDSSHRLLRYVQRKRLYHYLIDRFGRAFRVVAEDARANHAGHSIWAAADGVHLNLNSAFLGVSFESRWEGGHALPITQAQLAAGRNLTEYLRQRYGIAPEMCVTHGLTSVNPRKHLIGHHLDWARGFPFEAFGLPDQYRQPAPSVALFGFAYDDDFLKVLGEPWPGVRSAEAELAREAVRLGQTAAELRRERQTVYDEWLAEQTRVEAASGGPGTAGSASVVPASARTSGPTRALSASGGPYRHAR